jgi:membrane-associated protein
MHGYGGRSPGVDTAGRTELRDGQHVDAQFLRGIRQTRSLLPEDHHALPRYVVRLNGHGALNVVDTDDRESFARSPRAKVLHARMMADVLVAVSDHGASTVPPPISDDVHLCGKERVGGPHDRADVRIVLEVLDRHVEGVPAFIKISDDRLHRPVAVAIHDISSVPVLEEFGVKTRVHAATLVPPVHRPTPYARRVPDVTLTLLATVSALGPDWLNPETLLTSLGDIAFWVVLGIIFAECGLLIGFFLPGDSLLFVTGLFIASGYISINIWLACAMLFVAAVAGNAAGYGIGYQVGPALFKREDSRLFKKAYVDKTHAFFDKYGGRAIILARFVPIVRTFITAVAGVGRMDFKRYMFYSAIGGLLWAVGVTLLGYFLGTIPFVAKNIEVILIIIVLISVVPIAIEWIRHRRSAA